MPMNKAVPCDLQEKVGVIFSVELQKYYIYGDFIRILWVGFVAYLYFLEGMLKFGQVCRVPQA